MYRFLARGKPVSAESLAHSLNLTGESVRRLLRGWPGVYYDEHRQVIGYWASRSLK